MSLVPFRESRRRSRRPPLDRGQVVRAALHLLDEVGLDELTMRRLAERLGVQAASLYRHVRDKEELLVLLADEICGEIAVPPATGPWDERLAELARASRRGLGAHRDGARLLASTAPVGPRRLRLIEALLGALRASGMADRFAAQASHHLNNFVTEFAADEGRLEAAARALGTTRRKLLADARKHFRALPAAEFPALAALAGPLTEDDPDGLFELGLRIWLAGLRQLLPARSMSGRPGRT